MQFLTHGVREFKQFGIFVAFEEAPDRIVSNLKSFGSKLDELHSNELFFLDAQPQPDFIQSGSFDISGIPIIKSRGTSHSNQVRELILSDDGVTLAGIYTAGGEVLIGTLRWEKESAEHVANQVAEVAANFKKVRLDAEEAVLEVRAKSLQIELVAKQVEKTLLQRTTESREREQSRGLERMKELRGADIADVKRKVGKS